MTNIRKFPNKHTQSLPEDCKNTKSYPMGQIFYSPAKLDTVTDFTNGEKRNMRWGLAMSLAIMPQLDKFPVDRSFTIMPYTDPTFFTADSIEELKARIMHEVDKAMEQAKLAVEDPEEYVRRAKEQMSEALASQEDDMS